MSSSIERPKADNRRAEVVDFSLFLDRGLRRPFFSAVAPRKKGRAHR
jgi:hypothetical protein